MTVISACTSIEMEYLKLSIHLIIFYFTISDIACTESGIDGHQLYGLMEIPYQYCC